MQRGGDLDQALIVAPKLVAFEAAGIFGGDAGQRLQAADIVIVGHGVGGAEQDRALRQRALHQ